MDKVLLATSASGLSTLQMSVMTFTLASVAVSEMASIPSQARLSCRLGYAIAHGAGLDHAYGIDLHLVSPVLLFLSKR